MDCEWESMGMKWDGVEGGDVTKMGWPERGESAQKDTVHTVKRVTNEGH